MKCNKVRITDICKECVVGDKTAECPTYQECDNNIKYLIPPSTIFDLVPYKNNVGEKIICVDDHNSRDVKIGEVFTIIEQVNEQIGYIRIDKFKDYPNMWFGLGGFKKLKATYNGTEYTLRLTNE